MANLQTETNPSQLPPELPAMPGHQPEIVPSHPGPEIEPPLPNEPISPVGPTVVPGIDTPEVGNVP